MTCGPAFVSGLRGHGDRVAVICGGERVSYRQLAERVERAARTIGAGRRLVLVEAANDVTTVVGYLAALHGGHVALLADRGDPTGLAALIERFDPDVVVGAAGEVRERRSGSRHRLHPDLALLLSTSGSTGTPKLVRLSAQALDANAAAISTYLDITAGDRAALTLPLHYCYGLSVINSNLLCGAAVLLSDASVLDAAFWRSFAEHEATSLHGVPYTFDLLDRVGFAGMSLPHLRYVTQAGGRLAPDQVRRWARVGRKRGWQLYVMYGQTEATARMAYLPPGLAEAQPDAIGVPIPGGSLTVEPLEPGGEVGELVYRGPNVMLGYAHDPADLAEGRTVHALRTGDLGRRRPDGLFEIVGRRARFVKPFGIRTDLDGVEHLLAEHGVEAACTGTDDQLVIAARTTATDLVRDIVTGRLALPATAVTVLAVADLPRLPNGKLDHPAVARLARPQPPRLRGVLRSLIPRRRRPGTVREVFANTFGGRELTDDASFVDLGGDSLTYVQVSADIERVLGTLPPAWDHTPLGRLEAMATAGGGSGRATIETGVLLRALAIVLVVGEHAHLWSIVGGAHLMLALSGWTFARFVLADGEPAGRALPLRILRSTARIAVPSSLWIAWRALMHNVRFVDIFLVGSLVPPLVAGYWFVDALVQVLLLLALMFTLPALRDLERRHPFGFAAALLAIALAGRLFPTATGWWFTTDIYSTQVVLWLFALGWMAHRARSSAQSWATVAAVLVLVPTFFGADALRTVIVAGGLLLLQFLPTVTVPRAVAGVATTVASASLGIYLTHFGVLPLATLGVPPIAVVAVSIATGLAAVRVLGGAFRSLAAGVRNAVELAGRSPGELGRPEPDRPIAVRAAPGRWPS